MFLKEIYIKYENFFQAVYEIFCLSFVKECYLLYKFCAVVTHC